VLGGSMSSRLFQRIREELGMAYSIYSFPNSYVDCGTFGVYAGVSPKNGMLVLEEICKELKRLTDDGITDKEFRDAKTQLRGGYLLGLESPGGRMQAMGRSLLHLGRIFTPDETIRKIESLTYDEVMEYARKSLTVVPCLSAAGKNAEDFGNVSL
jgi:predicted Zn-dependent peptidase